MGMLSAFKALIAGGPLYVRIGKNRLSVKDVASGRQYEDLPTVAIKRIKSTEYITAVGSDAESAYNASRADTRLVNAFAHPRVIVSDFTVAEKALKYFLQKVQDKSLFRPSPVIILQVTEPLEGGLTPIEVRALQELAMSTGARAAHVWDGRELSDQELLTGSYPGNHWLSDPPK